MVNDTDKDEIDSMLDEQLEQIEKAEKRKNKFYKKLQVKRGMLIILVLVVLSIAGIASLLSGINNAVNKNQAIIAEAKQEADKKGVIKIISEEVDSKNRSSKAKSLVKIENLQRKALIEKREDSNEKQRLTDAKQSNRSVIAKLDELKTGLVSRVSPLSRLSKSQQRVKSVDLTAALQSLFKTDFDILNSKNTSGENFEWLVAANTGGQNGSKLKASVEYHHNDLSKLTNKKHHGAIGISERDWGSKETSEPLKISNSGIDSSNGLPAKHKNKLGITRLVTQEESAMLLMKIDSSKDSPITARIMDTRSDLDGAKLACEFNLTQDQQAVQIKCNKLVIQNQSYSVNIIMLDPATRNANIVDKIDTHWWKWLAFSATTFAEGYLNFATTKTTVINTDGSQTSQTAAIEDAGARNRAALANIGKTAIASGGNILDIPNQVYVDEYRPVILLYLDDLNI